MEMEAVYSDISFSYVVVCPHPESQMSHKVV